MTTYRQPSTISPVVYFMGFLFIVSIAFAVFFTILARPLCKLKNRMHNSDTPWLHVRENIVKINYGDTPSRVKALVGEPDEVIELAGQTLFRYQKYGIYKPSFVYDIEFREDTLYQIVADN
jgi:hypothetical protein